MGSADLTPTDPRRVLERYGLRPKRSWGQNFLLDVSVGRRIVEAADLAPDDVVVEIGAGAGALTKRLANAAARVIAVERDPDLLAVLRAEMAAEPGIEICAEDALRFDFSAAARAAGRPLVAVGNLPYQITSPLLFAVVRARHDVKRAVVMVQREVAERMVSPPGGKSYGRLSVMLQQAASVRILFHVSPGAFFPRPKVVSSVVWLEPRPAPLAPVREEGLFAHVVRAAFGARRKTLRRALAPAFGPSVVGAALERAAIEGGRRAETLSVAEFGRLTDALHGAGAPAPSGAIPGATGEDPDA